MNTFIKVNIASLMASGADYLVTILLVQFVYTDKLLAGIAGTISGGFVNFLINRHWVFKAHGAAFSNQGKKYLLTWFGNLILNSSGLFLMIKLLKVQYIVAKITISFIVAIFYNYPLQKRFVFKLSD